MHCYRIMAKLWLSYSGFWQNSDFFLKSCNFQCMQYLKLNTFKRIQCTNEYIKYIDFCGPGTTILTGHERKWCYIFHQTTVTPTEFSCRKLVLYCVKSEDFEASKCGGRQYAWRVPSSETPRSAYLKKKKKQESTCHALAILLRLLSRPLFLFSCQQL